MRAYLTISCEDFFAASSQRLLHQLIQGGSGYDLQDAQKRAWQHQIELLKSNLSNQMVGRILFEFTVPRVGKRVDVVIVTNRAVFVLEFKVNADEYLSADKDQALDYALDLKNFHETSHDTLIVPILIATAAENKPIVNEFFDDGICKLNLSNGSNIANIFKCIHDAAESNRPDIEVEKWELGRYKPTPTIIEAARALYEGHSVAEISRSEAGVQNLSQTNDYVQSVINAARQENQKVICFITGVPGSGKTLAGLNIATSALEVNENRDGAVFLSGNGPLVDVLQQAIARNEIQNAKNIGVTPPTKTEALRKSRTFVQIIHRWRDEYLIDQSAPEGRVVVFDEAQRAWTADQTSNFMKTKKGLSGFTMSEPEYLLSVMERHEGWCAVICLIGGGQEINTGEAGIGEWLSAASRSSTDWRLHISDKLSTSDVFGKMPSIPPEVVEHNSLHLSTSVRSFRAELLSGFVGAILSGDLNQARMIKSSLNQYPIFLSRDLNEIRQWLRSKARGSERYGLVASSNAMRLKPEGIHVKSSVEPATWFLNGKEDVRSSFSLEDAATEFDVQGLELDWVGMCWDANLVWNGDGWLKRRFSGTKWQVIQDEDRAKYLLNSYRVLLTRARQGLAIFVPKGSVQDLTRTPRLYEDTYRYLDSCIN